MESEMSSSEWGGGGGDALHRTAEGSDLPELTLTLVYALGEGR